MWYPALISCQPGMITQFRSLKAVLPLLALPSSFCHRIGYKENYIYIYIYIYLIIDILLNFFLVKWICLQVDKFTFLGSSVSSTEKDIDTQLTKARTAIDRLSIISKSDLTDKMKRSFFQAAVVSILLYGCTTWTLTKRLEKKLDGNYTRMLQAILNKSRR